MLLVVVTFCKHRWKFYDVFISTLLVSEHCYKYVRREKGQGFTIIDTSKGEATRYKENKFGIIVMMLLSFRIKNWR